MQLPQFPVEILRDITSRLNAPDICHLFWTGQSRLIRSLIHGGVSEFHYIIDDKLPNCGVVRWPTLASSFTGLRKFDLQIFPGLEFRHSTRIPVSDPRPDLLPSSIEELTLRFLQAEGCFLRYPSDSRYLFPHQFAQEAKVELADYSGSEEMERELLEGGFMDENGEPLTRSEATSRVEELIKNVPIGPAVQLYSQQEYAQGSWTEDGRFNWSQLFPRLRHLSLLGEEMWKDIQQIELPSTLESLRLGAKKPGFIETCYGRPMPLTHFEVPHFSMLSTSRDALPFLGAATTETLSAEYTNSRVQHLHLRSSSAEISSAYLPRTLNSLGIDFNAKGSDFRLQPEIWPPHLTTLFLVNGSLPPFLPPGLRKLSMSGCTLPTESQLKALPATLEEFFWNLGSTWSRSQFLLLPRSLTTLGLQGVLESGNCQLHTLQDLATFPRLSSLNLGESTVPVELIEHLPKTLTSLTASITPVPLKKPPKKGKFPQPPASPDLLPSLQWPPSLQALTVSVRRWVLDATFASDLPCTLRSLTVQHCEVTTTFFEHLPPNLLILEASVEFWSTPSPLLAVHLPKSLTLLNPPPSAFSEAHNAVLLFPRSMSHCSLLYPNSMSGARCRHLPPSWALQSQWVECKPTYDLPPKKPQ